MMYAVFNTWEALNKALNNEGSIWADRISYGEEVLAYEAPSGQLVLTDEPIDNPDYTEIEL